VAVVRKTGAPPVAGKPAQKLAQVFATKVRPGLTLPTELSVPPTHLAGYSCFFFGEGGVGKSSFVSRFGSEAGKKVMFFVFETAQSGLKLYKTAVLIDWDMVIQYAEMLRDTEHEYGAVCLDTGNPAYARCLEYVCRKEHIQHPGKMEDYGASWKKVGDEFKRLQTFLAGQGISVIVTAHDKLTEITTRSGGKIWRVEPNLSGSCMTYYRENSDIIGYYFHYEGKRYMQIVGDDFVMAKANPEDHFHTPDGRRIHRVPMGASADEGYENFMAAFNNEQEEPLDELSSSKIADEAASRAKRKHTKNKK
jgi:hypothetical protein